MKKTQKLTVLVFLVCSVSCSHGSEPIFSYDSELLTKCNRVRDASDYCIGGESQSLSDFYYLVQHVVDDSKLTKDAKEVFANDGYRDRSESVSAVVEQLTPLVCKDRIMNSCALRRAFKNNNLDVNRLGTYRIRELILFSVYRSSTDRKFGSLLDQLLADRRIDENLMEALGSGIGIKDCKEWSFFESITTSNKLWDKFDLPRYPLSEPFDHVLEIAVCDQVDDKSNSMPKYYYFDLVEEHWTPLSYEKAKEFTHKHAELRNLVNDYSL